MTAPELSFGGPQNRVTEVSLTVEFCKFETGNEGGSDEITTL